MEIVSPSSEDWESFLDWARQEGWCVPRRELDLYRREWKECAFVLRDGEEPVGFVTAVRHDRSGWIGNLIVAPDRRSRGFGGLLFDHAVEALRRQRAGSVWLTASEQGRPLYEKRGFRRVDTVERWVLQVAEGGSSRSGGGEEALRAGDRHAWGESRQRLLDALLPGGSAVACGTTAALLQGGEPMQVLGPWISPTLCPRENRQVLQAVLAAASPGEIVSDVLATSPVRSLLSAAGFAKRGECALMAQGDASGADLSVLVSLGSLGSMG